MRGVILASMLCVATVAGAATVYKWVDAQGVIHYSDQPHPGAEKIEVSGAQTYRATAPDARASANTRTAADDGPPYRECELFRPANDEVFLNADTVPARLRVQPPVRAGDRLALALDGRRLEGLDFSASELVIPVVRGTHSLLLVVEDRQGQIVCQSAPVTFHVRQPSIQQPNHPANRPRPTPRA